MKLIHSLFVVISSAFASAWKCRLIAAANDDETLVPAANGSGGEAVFDVQQGEKLTIPYGDYPHAKGLQKFDKASAERIVGAFNSIGSKIARLFTKAAYPIYKGHPDVPGRPDTDPAAPAVGWVTGVTAENDGMSLDVKWGAEGQRCIENGEYRFYSPYWLMRPVAGGMQPVELLSVGLTNNPKINVPAIANDATDAIGVTTELVKLLGLEPTANLQDIVRVLREQWFKVREFDELLCILAIDKLTATKELILAAAKALKEKADRVTTAENDRDAATERANKAEADLATARGQLTEAGTKLTAAENDLTVAKDALGKEREGRIDARLDLLVAGKSITFAQRTEHRAKLIAAENDDALEALFVELAKGAGTLPNQSLSKDLGKKNSEAAKKAANDEGSARRSQIRDAVAAEAPAVTKQFPQATESRRYEIAWDRASKKNPQLFGNA